jgi:hypothetical protein
MELSTESCRFRGTGSKWNGAIVDGSCRASTSRGRDRCVDLEPVSRRDRDRASDTG